MARDDTTPDATPRRALKPQRWPLMLGGLVVIGVAVALLVQVWRNRIPPAENTPQDGRIAEAPPPAAPPQEELAEPTSAPPSALSESALRARLQNNEYARRWFAVGDLQRRLVAAVGAIAEGDSPRQPLGFLDPTGPFSVERRGDTFIMSKRSEDRYDAVANTVATLSAEDLVGLYRHWRPRLEEIHQELGQPGRSFDQTLRQAIDHLLATPLPRGQPALVAGEGATYLFENQRLQKASAAQKHLIRMGRRNARVIKAKMSQVRDHMQPKPASPVTQAQP